MNNEDSHELPEAVFFNKTGDAISRYISQKGLDTLGPAELKYLKYRCDGYLASSAWQSLNTGVKLCGALCYKERTQILLELIKSKKKLVKLLSPVYGGFGVNPFVRRNTIYSLTQMNIWNEEIENAILNLFLKDSYFEVQTACIKAFERYADDVINKNVVEKLIRERMKHKRFDVVCAAIEAMGKFDIHPAVFEEDMMYSVSWKIRASIIKYHMSMFKRGLISVEYSKSFMDDILITSTGFIPNFQLKFFLKSFAQLLSGGDADV